MILAEVKHILSYSHNHTQQQTQLERDKIQLYSKLLLGLDIVTCVWMTIEFILRFLTCPDKKEFVKRILNVIDFISIIPYFFHFYDGSRNGYIRMDITIMDDVNRDWIYIVSAVRLFRLLRFFRLSTGLEILQHTMIASVKEILLLIFMLVIPVCILATFVYHTEKYVSFI